MLQQAYTPSNTGIASFVHASADYDLAPMGIGSMRDQVNRLAEFGRNGDVYVVHAAEGETVVPMEVLDSNPKVKEMLFAQMRDMGLDPERYVVGNELNSINPDTGMPEFWFSKIWKKVKTVFKKVAPILAVVVGNAVLPGIGGIIASMAYTKLSGGSWKDTLFAGISAYAGGVLAGGIGGLGTAGGFMGGASSAAATPFTSAGWRGAWARGAGSWFGAPGGAAAGAGAGGAAAGGAPGAPGAGGAPAATGSSLPGGGVAPDASGVPIAGGGWDPGGPILPAESAGAGLTPGTGRTSGGSNVPFNAPTPISYTATPNAYDLARAQNLPMDEFGNYYAPNGQVISPDVSGNLQGVAPPVAPVAAPVAPTAGSFQTGGVQPGADTGWGDVDYTGAFEATAPPDSLGDTLSNVYTKYSTKLGGYVKKGSDLLTGESADPEEVLKLSKHYQNLGASKDQGYALAFERLNPGPLRTYGPSAALLGLAGIPLGFYDDEEEDPAEKAAREEAEKRIREATSPSRRNQLLLEYRELYEIPETALDPTKYEPAKNPRSYPITQPVNFARAGSSEQFNPLVQRYTAADGGFIDGQPRYPRREMLVEGPGTERSDDIPAMLSDGEFVLNSRSVRGADPTGQGNRYRGAQNLYNMMRNFEMRG